jgi:hypothetical protein
MIRKALKAFTLGALMATSVMVPSSYGAASLNPVTFGKNCKCSILGFSDGTNLHILMYEAGSQQINDDPISFSKDYADLSKGPNKDLPGGTLAITTTNFSFVAPQSLVLIVNAKVNGKDEYSLAIKPTSATATSIEFNLDPSSVLGYVDQGEIKTDLDIKTIDEITAFVGIRQQKGGKLEKTMQVSFPALTPGLKGTISITLVDSKNNHVHNGCVKTTLYEVKNQYIAKSVGIDDEPLAVASAGNKVGILKLFDEGTNGKPVATVMYKRICDEKYNCNILAQANKPTATCPSVPSASCALFCNSSTRFVTRGTNQQQPTTQNVSCVDPDPCTNPQCSLGDRLAIYQSLAPQGACYRVVSRVISLAQTKVKLTLKGSSFAGIKTVTFKTPVFDNKTGKLTGYKELCSVDASKIKDNTATCTIDGGKLFTKEHKSPTGAVDVTFDITVDGQTPLSPREFYASAELYGGFVKHPAYLNWGKVMTWGAGSLNATASFKIPYVRSDSIISTGIRIENSSSSDVTIAFYVTDPKGGWKFIKAVSLKAGSAQELHGIDLEKWAKNVGLDLATVKEGKFALLGVMNLSPCSSQQNAAGCQDCYGKAVAGLKNINIYASQQIKHTNNIRYVPVQLVPGVPSDLHF